MAGNIINMSTDKARILSTQPGTSLFWRGDNSWSNILKQTSDMGLGIDTNLKIGTARKDLNFDITNGSGTDINEGYAGGITWGSGASAYAGIYYQTSGDYGSRLHFATTSSYSQGAYTRLFIAHDGKIGINTLSPSEKLEVNGTARFNNTVYFANGTTYYISSGGSANISQLITNSTATIKSTMRLNNAKNDIGIYYRYNNNTSDSGYCGLVRSNPGDGDLYYNVRFRFLNWSYDSSSKARLDTYEYFDLPTVTADRTSSAGYSILTTKNTVTIAQGGTSATSAAGARYNLSVPAMSLSTSYPKLMAINSSGEAVDNWIMIGSTTTYGILPGASGGAGSGHCYIGTSSWYWKYAYIDQIYGYLNGSCSGSSGSCTGNAATATTASACSGNAASATKVGIAAIWMYPNNSNEVNFGGTYTGNRYIYFGYRATDSRQIPTRFYFGSTGTAEVYAGKVYNAVWNDYAEYRKVNINEPGRVVVPSKTGTATKSTMRLQAGGRIISDTFGCSVGKSNEAKTPLGMAGRVLAYPYRTIEEYQIGDCVCTAPNGTVDIMTREEIKEYPDRIIGIVNEIPTYEIWEQKLTNDDPIKSDTLIQSVKVNGRIWIDIK